MSTIGLINELNRRIRALEDRVTKLEKEAEAKRTAQNEGTSKADREFDHADPWNVRGPVECICSSNYDSNNIDPNCEFHKNRTPW